MRFLARTLRGTESIAADELTARLGVSAEIGHRELRFELAQLTPAILELGAVDDAFLILSEAGPIGHQRAELGALATAGRGIDLDRVARALQAVRGVEGRSFDVSASSLGARNYSRYEIEDAVGEAIASAGGWSYASRSRENRPLGALSLRVHLTPQQTTVAVRLAEQPLHRRSYRVASLPGALHPPLAAALARIAGAHPAAVLADPFCGTGTIVIEAALAEPGLRATGYDLDVSALEAARSNAAAASVAADFVFADAGSLPIESGSLTAVATNPPWGLRLRAGGSLAGGFDGFWSELARVLRGGGGAAILVPREVDLPRGATGLETVSRDPVRVSGAIADILVLARTAR